MSLPASRADQVYVTVSPLAAGTLTLPEYAFITPVDRSIKHSVPSLCFLISHPNRPGAFPTRFLFDLGLRGSATDYIPAIQAHLPSRQPVTHRPSAPETLLKNGIPLESIRAVLLSHVHWDHHGDPGRFGNATFIVGHGSMDVLEHGMPGRGSHSHFDKDLFRDVKAVELSAPAVGALALGNRRTEELPDGMWGAEAKWEALGPFPAAVDVFGDGAVYVIPAPGHLPGHINLLCRTGEKNWMYLGGDVFHDKRLLTGEKSIATWEEDGHSFCVHVDKAEAERSIERIRELGEICKKEGLALEVVVAHDNGWYEANKGRCMI